MPKEKNIGTNVGTACPVRNARKGRIRTMRACICCTKYCTKCRLSVSVVRPLVRGRRPFSEVLDVAQEAEFVRLVMSRRGERRLVSHVDGRQVVVQARVRTVRVDDVVGMGNLEVPWWRGSGEKWARVPTRENRGRRRRLYTGDVVLLLALLTC